MDYKEIEMIDHFLSIIKSEKYTEKDIYAFLMLLRPYSEEGSALREFSNFIAHRNKDRESIKNYCDNIQNILDNLGRIKTKMVIKPAYTINQLSDSLNCVLSKIGNRELNINQAEVILLCIMILLQGCYLYRNQTELAKLSLGIFADIIILLANVRIEKRKDVVLQFPVLEVHNKYFDVEMAKGKGYITPGNGSQFCYAVRIRNIENKLKLDFIESIPLHEKNCVGYVMLSSGTYNLDIDRI